MDFEFGSMSRVAAESLAGAAALRRRAQAATGGKPRIRRAAAVLTNSTDGVCGDLAAVALPDLCAQAVGRIAVVRSPKILWMAVRIRFGLACLRSRMPARRAPAPRRRRFWSIIGLAGMTICGTPNDNARIAVL